MRTLQGNQAKGPGLDPLIGEFVLVRPQFPGLEEALSEFNTEEFQALSRRKRFKRVNQILLALIQEEQEPCFLLAPVIDYIQRINQGNIFTEEYRFTSFEFWLNHFSGLTEEDAYRIRGKIMGRLIPRDEYQVFFPIGMNKVFYGTHFVTAHLSPDVDTMIASFWGWADAFAARVGTGQHIWSLPGGPPDSPAAKLFQELFGKAFFDVLPRVNGTLTLSAMDLVTQRNLLREPASTSVSTLDHGYNEKALILVDGEGHYLGDWRSMDVEVIRQIVVLFKSCLHWFQNNLHGQLIALFAKPELTVEHLPGFLSSVYDVRLKECGPVKEFSDNQKADLNSLLQNVLGMGKGLEGTFEDLSEALSLAGNKNLSNFKEFLSQLKNTRLFDQQGRLMEHRPEIFRELDIIFYRLADAIMHVRDYAERLDIVMAIKTKVLNKPSQVLTMASEIEDIRNKMKNYEYLTVVVPEGKGAYYPVGVVWAADLRKPMLGTVSFRDFCNLDEVKMASYLSVISVIDHHKTALKTNSTPLTLIGDAQSCNVLIAEQSLPLNEKYGLRGMDQDAIQAQIDNLKASPHTPANLRGLQRLWKNQQALQSARTWFVHPDREIAEYLFYLHAILDDTDLLTKVSNRDVECVAKLLNRLKSTMLRKEAEIIDLESIPKDKNFVKAAAKRILQTPDMFSIYSKIFSVRQKEVEDQLNLSAEGKPSNIFADVKEQNGCCRISQTKMFSSNYPLFETNAQAIRKQWYELSRDVFSARPEIDLHMHMLSTIPNSEEVFTDKIRPYGHRDELWFWIPSTQSAIGHLALFLGAFQGLPEISDNALEVEYLGQNAEVLQEIFQRNFLRIPQKFAESRDPGLPLAILRYRAGSINSRKSMISPYLPRLIA